MTEILRVAEAVLYVEDLPRAVRFYKDVLGLPETARFGDASFLQTGPNSTVILFAINQLEQRESPIPAHGARGQGHVALAVPVDQMDAWRERLRQYGVDIEHEQDWPQGTHSIYFRDPDRNSLELIHGSHYLRNWEKLARD